MEKKAEKCSTMWRIRQRSAVYFVEQGREVQYSVENRADKLQYSVKNRAEKFSTFWRTGQKIAV